ncbi:hypothetical protein BU197_16655, partial [Streptomyces sp. CBMA291]|nr:hypothetical protein [Streptomyces sp. CBMA291]
AALAALRRRAATTVGVTSAGVTATLPPGTTGTAVVAAPRIAGWHCEGTRAESYGGFLAVRLAPGTTTLSCTFRTPGLRAGLAAGAAGALLLGAGVWTERRRRAGPLSGAG